MVDHQFLELWSTFLDVCAVRSGWASGAPICSVTSNGHLQDLCTGCLQCSSGSCHRSHQPEAKVLTRATKPRACFKPLGGCLPSPPILRISLLKLRSPPLALRLRAAGRPDRPLCSPAQGLPGVVWTQQESWPCTQYERESWTGTPSSRNFVQSQRTR